MNDDDKKLIERSIDDLQSALRSIENVYERLEGHDNDIGEFDSFMLPRASMILDHVLRAVVDAERSAKVWRDKEVNDENAK